MSICVVHMWRSGFLRLDILRRMRLEVVEDEPAMRATFCSVIIDGDNIIEPLLSSEDDVSDSDAGMIHVEE